jgi:hypothetical protein
MVQSPKYDFHASECESAFHSMINDGTYRYAPFCVPWYRYIVPRYTSKTTVRTMLNPRARQQTLGDGMEMGREPLDQAETLNHNRDQQASCVDIFV